MLTDGVGQEIGQGKAETCSTTLGSTWRAPKAGGDLIAKGWSQ